VRAGSVYLYSHDERRVQVSSVDRVALQSSFDSGLSSDVALVRLTRSLAVTSSVRSVCLHSGAAVYAQPGSGGYGTCVVAGWPTSRAASSSTSLWGYSDYRIRITIHNEFEPKVNPTHI